MTAGSWKEFAADKFPTCNSVKELIAIRRLLRDEFQVQNLKKELIDGGVIENEHYLTTGVKPFNIFSRLGSGVMVQDNMKKQQEHLENFQDRFLVACNRPENDEHWSDGSDEWKGKASMSQRHQFLIIKGDERSDNKIHWQWYNALVFGMLGGITGLKSALNKAIAAKSAALTYTRNDKGWSSKVGLFLHTAPFNSVNHFHLHMVDLTTVGPTYQTMVHKNLPIDALITVLWYEIHDSGAAGYSARASEQYLSRVEEQKNKDDDELN